MTPPLDSHLGPQRQSASLLSAQSERRHISYSQRSSFLSVLRRELSVSRDQILNGDQITISLDRAGGYSGTHHVHISEDDTSEFICSSFRGDPTRFPARIKAVATTLFELKLWGAFNVAHRDGVVTLQTAHLSSPAQLTSARIARDKVWLAQHILEEPAVYHWWMPEALTAQLSIPIDGCDRHTHIGPDSTPQDLILVYVGIANSLRERLDWHICQRHTPSCIKSGYLSTLRVTLTALMRRTLSDEHTLNALIDELSISYEYCTSRDEALNVEARLMRTRSLPLNIQGNRHPFKAALKALRAECKRRSLSELKPSARSS